MRSTVSTRVSSSTLPVPKATARRHLLARNVRQPVHASVQLSAEFLDAVRGALDRESQKVAEFIGLPGLTLCQEYNNEDNTIGQFIWSSGIVLARKLRNKHFDQLAGVSVLELGCGTGIVGVTCAGMGAQVTLTDLPEVLPTAEHNIGANAELITAAGGTATMKPLDWASPDNAIMDQTFEYILGADLVYEASKAEPVARLYSRFLARNPEVIIRMAHEHREVELDDYMADVFKGKGLELTLMEDHTYESASRTVDVSIYKVSKGDAGR